MNFENRIKNLEQKIIVPEQPKYHLVFVEPGANKNDEIGIYKAKNEVAPDDRFFVIQFVSSKGRKKNGSK